MCEPKLKKISVFTSIRSEYGLLSPLLTKLKDHPRFKLDLLVGGAHLLEEYGNTISFIEADGFSAAYMLPFLYTDKSKDVLTKSLSSLLLQIGKYFSENNPDLLIVLGDRFELIPVALAASLYKVPIAHISGGETTEGALDNQIRHALTKMSHIHFPATNTYRQNIISMGEEPWRVCVSGEPGLDLIDKTLFVEKEQLYKYLGLDMAKDTALLTFHPETIASNINPELVLATCILLINKGYQVLATASNFDEGGDEINAVYETLAKKGEIVYQKSLGQRNYYSMLSCAAVMVGNSSSGLVEAQSFNLPVLNVGDRQRGRLTNLNVVHVDADINEIDRGLRVVMSDAFKSKYFDKPNIYGDGKACDRILSFLDRLDWPRIFMKKDCFNVVSE